MNNKPRDFLSPPPTDKTIKQSPGRQPQAVPQKVLSGLFTKQFLINVKNQLNKTKSPRVKQQGNCNQFTNINSYKAQIQILRAKLKQLTKQNTKLKEKLSQIAQNGRIDAKIDKLDYESTQTSIYKNKLKLTSEVSLYITGQQFQDEIQKLRQKVENLEMYKAIKQKRFEQLLQKSIRYENQIMLLKVKQQDLQSEVKSLRQTIRIQVTDMNGKPLRTTNISENDGKSLYASNGIKLPFQKEEVNQMVRYMININKKFEDSLIMSQCRDVNVPDQMHISKMALRTSLKKEQSFNEIDYLISEQLPYLQVSQELKLYGNHHGHKLNQKLQKMPDLRASLQQSHLFIDLDSPCGKNAKNKELEQSLIKIQLDSKQIPEVPSSMQTSEIFQENKLNQSLVAINLNDF